METLIYAIIITHSTGDEKLNYESLFILFLLRQVVVSANTGRKKGYCILGD